MRKRRSPSLVGESSESDLFAQAALSTFLAGQHGAAPSRAGALCRHVSSSQSQSFVECASCAQSRTLSIRVEILTVSALSLRKKLIKNLTAKWESEEPHSQLENGGTTVLGRLVSPQLFDLTAPNLNRLSIILLIVLQLRLVGYRCAGSDFYNAPQSLTDGLPPPFQEVICVDCAHHCCSLGQRGQRDVVPTW